MEVRTVETVDQAFHPRDVAPPRAPELVLVGRSNVGKSSLINSLLGRRNLARVAKAPGKTRGAFFYLVNRGQLVLVDLPGYGFARGAKREVATWEKLTEAILERPGPRMLAILLDLRLSPQAIDLDAASWFSERCDSIILIGTKADKLKQSDLNRQTRALTDAFGHPVLPVSSKTGRGLREIWREIDDSLATRR